MQKYRQKIAIVTAISVLTVIILYINFTVWSANYIEGDVEDNIRQGMNLIAESHPKNPSTPEINNEILVLLSVRLIPVIAPCALIMCFLPLIEQIHQYNKNKTLFALSVRLNN